MSVQEKTAIVTGGASGIGRASALLLGEHGARVIVADRNLAEAEETVQRVVTRGGRASAQQVDVARSDSVEKLIGSVLSGSEQIDIVVHCAAICPRKSILQMSDEEWHEVIAVNLYGSFYIARAVGRAMTRQKAGTMIFLTSDRGMLGSPDYGHYAASKGGLIALVKSFAFALGPYGVTVNGVNPGFTDTPMARAALTEADWKKRHAFDPMGRHSEPEDIAQTVLFLAKSGGKYMTGQIVSTRMQF